MGVCVVATLRYEAQHRLALFVSNTEISFCINANAVADDVRFSLFSTHLLLLLLWLSSLFLAWHNKASGIQSEAKENINGYLFSDYIFVEMEPWVATEGRRNSHVSSITCIKDSFWVFF